MLLWIDSRAEKSTSELYCSLSKLFQANYLDEHTKIPGMIVKTFPQLLCFDYDCPDALSMNVLWQTKRTFPSLPILMLTRCHSEEMAVWALRARVWDLIVKPIKIDDLCARIIALTDMEAVQAKNEWEITYIPTGPIPVEPHFCNSVAPSQVTAPAVSYIEANYSEKVELDIGARLCGLGRFQFSRLFKKEQGLTFRNFLNQYRIRKAVELLKNTNASVTDIGFEVGFNNLSCFAQMFRRVVGCNPSIYRNASNKKVALMID